VADTVLAAGAEVPALHGVPFTVKENIDVSGSPTTQGFIAFEGAVADVDAPHIAQLRAAGAIPLARTNLPDFGLRWHTDNALRGPTLNPWDASRSPGGSSGGDAAALATGMSPLGMGNDYGGSLRVPAQFCGVASLRPTLGRAPFAMAFPPEDFPITVQLMAVQGPMARRVGDLRLALQHMCDQDPRDPWWSPAPLEGPPLSRRVAVWRGGDDAQVAAGVDAAAGALADAGYDIDEVDPPMLHEAARLWGSLVASDTRILAAVLGPALGADALRFLDTMFELTPDLDKMGYVEGLVARQGVARAWSRFQAERPLILGPVSTRSPFPVGRDLDGPAAVDEIRESMRLVLAVNVLGLPAAAVPVGASDGVPQAVQLIGPRYREDLCLDAAEAIESRLGILTPIDPL
jgi:amidase